MAADEKTNYTETLFESIKHINEYGQEFADRLGIKGGAASR